MIGAYIARTIVSITRALVNFIGNKNEREKCVLARHVHPIRLSKAHKMYFNFNFF
jgi:hypothetical protein